MLGQLKIHGVSWAFSWCSVTADSWWVSDVLSSNTPHRQAKLCVCFRPFPNAQVSAPSNPCGLLLGQSKTSYKLGFQFWVFTQVLNIFFLLWLLAVIKQQFLKTIKDLSGKPLFLLLQLNSSFVSAFSRTRHTAEQLRCSQELEVAQKCAWRQASLNSWPLKEAWWLWAFSAVSTPLHAQAALDLKPPTACETSL